VEGMKNYLAINTGEDQIITLLNIQNLEDRLPARQFMRVHKSYIVALSNQNIMGSKK
jgi:DNA-binding LytR/AlgR family response regulator